MAQLHLRDMSLVKTDKQPICSPDILFSITPEDWSLVIGLILSSSKNRLLTPFFTRSNSYHLCFHSRNVSQSFHTSSNTSLLSS